MLNNLFIVNSNFTMYKFIKGFPSKACDEQTFYISLDEINHLFSHRGEQITYSWSQFVTVRTVRRVEVDKPDVLCTIHWLLCKTKRYMHFWIYNIVQIWKYFKEINVHLRYVFLNFNSPSTAVWIAIYLNI